MRRGRRLVLAAVLALPLLLVAFALLGMALLRQGGMAPFQVPLVQRGPVDSDAAVVARGQYLARIGNCAGCHTPRGGLPYGGGRAFATPYGTVYSSNLTPDPEHGIGAWSLQEFRHAMRHGVSRNGVQSPVFPYANFALLHETDLDALFAFLATLPPVATAAPEDALRFPASLPGAMTAWRLLYYRPAPLPPTSMPEPWQRGRYLVRGLGHCSMCHAQRGALASLAASGTLAGGLAGRWYAPALDAVSLQRYPHGQLARYLRGGSSAVASAYGAMADVVFQSLQYLRPADADAIATYLLSLHGGDAPMHPGARLRAEGEQLAQGERIYGEHCADCHGEDGRGEPGRYPPLRGSVSVTAPDAVNAVNVVLLGAVAPSTALNPQPWSMPPFAHRLSANEVAAVVNFMRQRWGGGAPAITAGDVRRMGGTWLR